MKAFISTVFIASLSVDAVAELVQLEEKSLESVSAQAGLTIDIDISDLEFTYSYQNNENSGENYWVMGSNTGSGDLAVASTPGDVATTVGSGDGVVKFNGLTVDVGVLPDNAAISAISIGLPVTVELNRVNTGDYYIAHPNTSDPDSPPIAVNPATDRKLIGLKWNTPPPLNFAAGGQSGAAVTNVIENDFTSNPLQLDGKIYIFAN
jgi:hypothetical protein